MPPSTRSGGLLRPGDPAPDIALPDSDGRWRSLRSLLESGPIVLYFYPRDFTRNCTREACEFRDRHERFRSLGAHVVGVSQDSGESHRRFADRHRLPFALLSDRDGEVGRRFGVPRTLGIVGGRVTFVVAQDGRVASVTVSQLRPRKHVRQALRALEDLSTRAAPG